MSTHGIHKKRMVCLELVQPDSFNAFKYLVVADSVAHAVSIAELAWPELVVKVATDENDCFVQMPAA